MQEVSFRTVDEFPDFLPPAELMITELLRNIIFSCMPDVAEKLSYNVPFYKRHAIICFIWPSSVKWGNKMIREGLHLGFSKVYLLPDPLNDLDRGERKQDYW